MVRQDQIGERAGVVDEAAEADDERHVVDCLAHLQSLRRAEDRVRFV
jgi:hypothetical protein